MWTQIYVERGDGRKRLLSMVIEMARGSFPLPLSEEHTAEGIAIFY